MNSKLKNIIISTSFLLILVGFMVSNIFSQDKEISYEERRKIITITEIHCGEAYKRWVFSRYGRILFRSISIKE